MALTCGFYNSIYGDRKYSAIQLSSIFDGIIKDGIFATVGDAFTVSAGSEMQVIVGPGRAWFNHSWTLNDANLPIEVDDAEVVLDRIDAVVIEVNSDDSVRDNTVKMVKGRPSSTPEKPELLDTETVHQYALAYVTVRSGVTEITNADIENAVGTTETPFITGLLETIDATELMNQWNGQFQDWLNEADNSLENWETQATALQAQWTLEFNDWFEHLQNELDENQAAHLQHQIDELRVKSGMSAKILINSDPGSTVTVTKPDGTVVVATQVLGTTTQWECSTGEYGVHYIHSVLNGEDEQVSLNVDTCKIYTIDDDHMHADITVTFPSGFQCRCQGGSENLYATSNPFTFVVHNQTTYTITATKDGITYTETVEITTSGQEVDMFCPSVENAPTDDIQMWLYFGGITDKSYTTLSEVLADSTTLMALINDHNAVDYMVRSKSWASNKGLVPVMTSDNTPSGECIASGVFSSSFLKYYAFDGNDSTYWASVSGTIVGAWVGYKFSSPTKIKKVSLISEAGNEVYTVQGSNDGFVSDIHDLGTITTETARVQNSSVINNDNNYAYYRIICTSSPQRYNISINSLQFYAYAYEGNGITEDATAMSYIGLNNYASNTLLADSRTALVPKMTSATTPSGTVVASDVGQYSQAGYLAFDGNIDENDKWASGTSTQTGQYVGYIFTSPQVVKSVMVVPFVNSATLASFRFKIQGTLDNGNTWEDVSSEITVTPTNLTAQYFAIDNDMAYDGYRYYFTTTTQTNATILVEGQFYDKSGPVWLEEICNSQYFESVLNVKVPTMTDATHPSGEVFADSVSAQFYPYMAFDGSGRTSTSWSSDGSSTDGTHYLGYKFTQLVRIALCKITSYKGNGSLNEFKFKVQGSSDDFATIPYESNEQTFNNVANNTTIAFPITYSSGQMSFRTFFTKSTTYAYSHYYASLLAMQFYGRIDV